jgi:GTPase SAR1 family protein
MPISSSALRIVLFGMPGAGKSSLLGALAQAVEAHDHVLSYRLVDTNGALAELQRRLYENHPETTVAETVLYPVSLEPFGAEGSTDADPALPAVFIDSGGKTAGALLARRDLLKPDGSLAREILEADTLILVVDGSTSPAQFEREFGQLAHFLDLLEKSRALRADVAGLPIYLVLTKCDRLAQADDTSLSWIDKIEERKLQAGERFRPIFARQATTGPRPFGSIDLHLWATAALRPPLADTPANPLEPYGVAELFRQCVASARAFDQRESNAGARLKKAVLGSIGVMAVLALLVLGLALTRPRGVSTLELKVENFRSQEREQSALKKYRKLDARIKELEAIRGDPGFGDLPPERQELVRTLLHQLTEYRKMAGAYAVKLEEIRQPQDAANEQQLKDIEARLGDLEPPPGYKGDWSQTPIGQVRQQWLRDVDLIRKTVKEVYTWYLQACAEAGQVLRTGEAATLPARAKQLLEKKRPWFPEQEPDKPISRETAVPFKTVLEFDTVARIRERWEELKKELQVLANRASG